MKGRAFWQTLAGLATGAGIATLLYGALVESKKLKLVRQNLYLKDWPKRLDGFKIAVLADLHIRDDYSQEQAQKAVALALDSEPDMIVLAGDMIGYWKPEVLPRLQEVLEPLILMQGACVAVPGNHEYWSGKPEWLIPLFETLGIKMLQNENWRHAGITWIGIDSFVAGAADPARAMGSSKGEPKIVLWHEPDAVDLLPEGAQLMIAGHSHGGQFTFPWGWTPMHTKMGSKYPAGFYGNAPTPLYVSRGVGTTGPPSRLNCDPEVSLLCLRHTPKRRLQKPN